MNVNIKRLSADATTPTYAHTTDACFDLYAVCSVVIGPGETVLVPTGLAFEIPPGYEMQIRPRSGITLKTPLRVQLGTVDSGYVGEVGVLVDNTEWKSNGLADTIGIVGGDFIKTEGYFNEYVRVPEGSYIIRKGDRIAQAVIKPV